MASEEAEIRELQAPPEVRMGEIGKAGNSDYSTILMEDYNPDLRGWKAVETYDKMRRNDGKVRATLRVVKAPLLSGQWYVDPASESEEDHEAADFIEWAWNNMSRTPTQFLYEALGMLDFGFYPFEIVYELGEWNGQEVVKWRKFAPRHPQTISEWLFDDNGGLDGLRQAVEVSGDVTIPIEKLLVFTFDEEGNSPEGISLLRSAYKHWYYKEALYKIDAIQKERHGIGIPDIELPPNAGTDDKKYANELGRNLRTNEKSFIVRPHGMKVGFVNFEGTPVNVLESVDHHDLMIAANVLAQFLNLGSSNTGSRAISESQQDLFSRSVRYVGDLLRGVINRWAINKLLRYNMLPGKVELKVRRIGESADFRAFAVSVYNLVRAGGITLSDKDEAFFREMFDMPVGSAERPVEDRLPKSPQSVVEAKPPRGGRPTE